MQRFFILLFSLMSFNLNAQIFDHYQIELKQKSINGFGGLQSFVFGQDNGDWLLIGGRTDGLHLRQPPFAFASADNNTTIYVVNPSQGQVWTASLNTLSTALEEQLQSTNMQFNQRGNTLYITGGYGFSSAANDHITYNKLTAINIPQLITAIKNNQSISAAFRQISSPYVQVTGGQLGYMDSVFYLVGGQKFTGRYNPMNGPSFVQEYTYAIRKFKIQDDGTNLLIDDTTSIIDVANLRRRDYNMLPQIFQNGARGFTVFSGVFQDVTDLPYLNMIDILANGYSINNNISLHYNHYHCAKVALFDSTNNVAENVFFGGISQFYDSSGTLVQDDDVPFVKTIAVVSRDASGNNLEKKIGELPFLLGASSEFIPNNTLAHYEGEIFKSNSIQGDSVLLGHIVGGIESSQRNIFFINNGTQSSATSRIFEVWLKKKSPNSIDLKRQSEFLSQIQFYPNPSTNELNMNYYIKKAGDISILITNQQGQIVYTESWEEGRAGWQTETFELDLFPGTYAIRITDEDNIVYTQIFIKSE